MISGPVANQPLYKRIDNYVFNFDDMLGQGNFSKVYRGRHQITNETVAIKVIQLNSLKSKKLQQLLFSQIDVLKKLNHPNILKCYQVFTSNRNCYIITEICNGGDLQTKLRKQQHFSQSQAQPYILDIFKGLRYLAENHVIHRDIKVANIFLHNGIAKIADFGFAKFTKNNFKDINIGSPIYMSPEGFIDNIYGPKTDVWAFGIFIYELLHGKTPFSHCINQIDLRRQIRTPISYSSMRSELSFDIKDIIIKCLQINQQKRITVMELEQTPYFKRLLKYDSIPLSGHKKNNQFLSPMQNSLGNINSKPVSPNPIGLNSLSSNIIGNAVSNQNINFKRNVTDSLGYSLEKGRFNNTKSFYSSFQAQNNSYPRYTNDTVSTDPPQANKRAVSGILNPNIDSIKANSRPHSSQKNTVFYSKSFLERGVNPSNATSYTTQNSITTPPTSYAQQTKIQNNYSPLRPAQQYQAQNTATTLLPGLLNFKQAVNCLHYCRLIYKFIVLNREIEQNDRKLMNTVSALMFKILNEVTTKIDKKQIAYDEENNKKQMKLREVSSQYYRKYSADVERPFNRQISYQIMLSQVKSKVNQFELHYNKKPSSTYLLLMHFLVVIIQATQLLKKCASQMKFWDWSQYKHVQQFLSKNKNSASYQNYLDLRLKVLRY